MGLAGGLLGYLTGKAVLVVFTTTMYVGGFASAAGSIVCPPLAAVSLVCFTTGNVSGAVLISPIDPVSTSFASVAAIGNGPV